MDKLNNDIYDSWKEYLHETPEFTNIKKWDQKSLDELLHRIIMSSKTLSQKELIEIVETMKKEYLRYDELDNTVMFQEKER